MGYWDYDVFAVKGGGDETAGVPLPSLGRLAATVRGGREARGWSAADLAREAGVSRRIVLDCERGRVVPIGRLQDMFDALGIYDLSLPVEYA